MTTRTTSNRQAEVKGFLERLGKCLDQLSVWHKRALAMAAIIGTIVGVCATISNNLNSTLDQHISAQTETLSVQLEAQNKQLQEIRLDTLRVQLLEYMYNEPEAHDTILKLGYTYFVEYQGDWVMTNKFKEWANEQGVNIPFDLSH